MGLKVAKKTEAMLEGDMTPMIDMTFQLIAFLMVLVNFAAEEVNASVVLPASELAKPPEGAPPESRIVVQLTKNGDLITPDGDRPIESLKAVLSNEAYVLQSRGKGPGDATIIVRAHRDCKTGTVQEAIKICQEKKFDRFVLRAKEKNS